MKNFLVNLLDGKLNFPHRASLGPLYSISTSLMDDPST